MTSDLQDDPLPDPLGKREKTGYRQVADLSAQQAMPAAPDAELERLVHQMNLGFAEDTRNIDHLGDKVEGVWFVVRELARRAGAK